MYSLRLSQSRDDAAMPNTRCRSVVAAGADVTARYAFVVPEDRRDQATLYLDLDGVHAPATFTGSLPR